MEWFAPIVFVFIVTAGAVIGLLLVRRRINHAALARHNNVASAVFSVVGTLFTVLLAFVVTSSGNPKTRLSSVRPRKPES